ncbi:hypothetical protein FSP39_016051 [Pinctada imbricata]|uniref:Uncharacterized protein n=1 Tax=Pinctada imbricata TaxID=66713 RepID=A0AA88XJ61_PINIB|nr:hypothetical protein FSP39_016051 [Pinctada imbricata]
MADGDATKAARRQFTSLSEDDLRELIKNSESENTRRLTKIAVNVFRDYLGSKNENTDFEGLELQELDRLLGKFYVELRNSKGEPHCYRVTMEMKRQGNASISHHPPISNADMLKLYDYLTSSDCAKILQEKVFVDIMIHFGRRGRENLRNLKRSDFAVRQDAEGFMFVEKIRDEQTKIHQDDSCSAEGRIFVKFIRRLNPDCPFLFQQPRDQPKGNVYYNNVVLGHNKLGNMMPNISEAASLSMRYTNHSLRATTVHILDAAQIPSRHIMAVTGHKSENSLKTYSGQTTENTKKAMSHTLSRSSGAMAKAPVTSTITRPVSVPPVTTGPLMELNKSATAEPQSNLLNDGLDSLYANMQMTAPHVPPAPTMINCSNITITYNVNYAPPCNQ